MTPWSPLPDAPAYPAAGFARLADRIAALLGTGNDVVLVQAEAVVALEAAASSLGRPGITALNIVTSLYGAWFGGWLRRAGATVIDLRAEPGKPVTPDAVAAALAGGHGIGLLSMVHAESATGILNPLADIMALAKAARMLTVVDVVASFGGHAVPVDALGIDLAVVGPQKTIGGQAGCSAVSVSPRAWDAMNPPGEAPSVLSLAELRGWIGAGRGALPGTPSPIEFHALDAALGRIEAEGLSALIARHETAAAAMRAGVSALGIALWVPPGSASNLVTAGPVPEGRSADDLVAALPPGESLIAPGVGPAGDRLVRLNHTGLRACRAVVLSELAAYAAALTRLGQRVDTGAGLAAAAAVFDGAR